VWVKITGKVDDWKSVRLKALSVIFARNWYFRMFQFIIIVVLVYIIIFYISVVRRTFTVGFHVDLDVADGLT
jgi:hypothetical protein